jgi:hypothetical protein
MGGGCGIRFRQPEHRDQFIEEQYVIRAFLAAFKALPAPDKRSDRIYAFRIPH